MANTSTVSLAYKGLVTDKALASDPAQLEAVALLDEIGAALVALEADNGGLASFFKKRKSVPKGAYIWGEVGRGKTLLMDLFFDTVPIKAKRRVHFHEFMDEVHTSIATFRAQSEDTKGARDPIPFVIKPILKTTRLLCFDEFHVTDITKACR